MPILLQIRFNILQNIKSKRYAILVRLRYIILNLIYPAFFGSFIVIFIQNCNKLTKYLHYFSIWVFLFFILSYIESCFISEKKYSISKLYIDIIKLIGIIAIFIALGLYDSPLIGNIDNIATNLVREQPEIAKNIPIIKEYLQLFFLYLLSGYCIFFSSLCVDDNILSFIFLPKKERRKIGLIKFIDYSFFLFMIGNGISIGYTVLKLHNYEKFNLMVINVYWWPWWKWCILLILTSFTIVKFYLTLDVPIKEPDYHKKISEIL